MDQHQTQVGETVNFTLPNKEVTPGIVTRLKNSQGTNIDLTLFNNVDSGEFRNNSIHQNVKYSDDATQPGTWHHRQEAPQSQAASAR